MNIIHTNNPLHLIFFFQLFRFNYAFFFGVLFYQPRKELLSLFLGIGNVGMEFAGSEQIAIQNFAVVL